MEQLLEPPTGCAREPASATLRSGRIRRAAVRPMPPRSSTIVRVARELADAGEGHAAGLPVDDVADAGRARAGHGEQQLVVVAAGQTHASTGSCPAPRTTRRAPGWIGRRAPSMRAPVPLASAICRTASASPSLRSMQAVAARVPPEQRAEAGSRLRAAMARDAFEPAPDPRRRSDPIARRVSSQPAEARRRRPDAAADVQAVAGTPAAARQDSARPDGIR